MSKRTATVFSAAAAGVIAAGTLFLTAAPGNAATTQVSYTATGTTHLGGLEADLPLGPGSTDVAVDLQSGDLTADISLPPTRTEFTMFGFLPTYAEVTIHEPEEGLSGTFQDGVVRVSGDFSIQITEVGHGFLGIPMENCRTTAPATIALESEGEFLVAEGGTLTGTYELPAFEGCSFDTPIINALLAGQEHTITIDLAAA
ncbi:hypothetical protein RM780_23815 [Streptomyces sp. DSM 44917]|uniref:Lipid/polyisoprenoid-binding YceI-like domain-containing protein n=1 Tax=Streptomyces boetiae TaxID=3075541 RepID=A0ABU2LEL4_9ACTN|nr:hypothetical protein [Streptomyces sp. DSM 44917]MDT0309957.1 hypothetical protein [Streptomyces sp. DSM 44917]